MKKNNYFFIIFLKNNILMSLYCIYYDRININNFLIDDNL